MKNRVQLSILQWNMGAAPLASNPNTHPNPLKCTEALTEILKDHSPTIALLQETNDYLLTNADLSAYNIQRGPIGLTVLIRRGSYSAVSNSNIRNRIQTVQLDSIIHGEPGLLVCNLHFPVLNLTEEQRREKARLFMQDLDQTRIASMPRFEIVAGDFNMPPYDTFIVGPTGLYANRDLRLCIKERRGTVGRAFYNVSWSIFGGNCGALGTYNRDNFPHGPWQIPDQMLLDPRIADKANIDLKVIVKHSKGELHSPLPYCYPRKTYASDHFPVLVSIS